MGEDAGQDPAIVRLAGEQDVSTRDDVRFAFQRARDNPRVIVDLTKLRHIDSTVISELMRAESRASANDGKLVIVARNQQILRVLSVAGITARTPILDTLDSAMQALRLPH